MPCPQSEYHCLFLSVYDGVTWIGTCLTNSMLSGGDIFDRNFCHKVLFYVANKFL